MESSSRSRRIYLSSNPLDQFIARKGIPCFFLCTCTCTCACTCACVLIWFPHLVFCKKSDRSHGWEVGRCCEVCSMKYHLISIECLSKLKSRVRSSDYSTIGGIRGRGTGPVSLCSTVTIANRVDWYEILAWNQRRNLPLTSFVWLWRYELHTTCVVTSSIYTDHNSVGLPLG